MANKPETGQRIDEATGTQTVGHEWDGIEELDTPMPRWWLWCLYISIIWGIGYVIAYPAWPMIEKGTEGTLGWTSRGQLAEEMAQEEQRKAPMLAAISAMSIEELAADPEQMQRAVAGGRAAFLVNCVQCHGDGAAGSKGYPNLNDDDWLWGGDLPAIHATITHGIRQPGDDKTHTSTMPPFAGAFDEAQLGSLVNHVLSLSGKGKSNAVGAQLYTDNCVTCHGPSGEGDRKQGAPRLNDAIWLYGSSREEITQQILTPRMGVMPSWHGRLDPVTIKMLAAYVHSLGGGEKFVAAPAPAPTQAPVNPSPATANEQP